MPSSCCAVGCTNRSNTHPQLEFYRIPKGKHPFHQNRKKLWMNAIKRGEWTESEINNARICSAHFVTGKMSEDHTSPDFVPSVFAHLRTPDKINQQKQSRYERSVIRGEKRRRLDTTAGTEIFEPDRDPVHRSDCEDGEATVDNLSSNLSQNIADGEETVSKLQFDELSTRYSQLEEDHRNLQNEVYVLREENEKLKETLGFKRFGYENIKKNVSLFTFYTGLQAVCLFDWIVSKVKINLTKQAKISLEDHVLVVIMKLRLGLLNKDLAYRFSIPVAVISKILRHCLPIIARTLAPCIKWPSKEAVRKNMPKAFKRQFRNCRCVIDCTEIFIERPANLTSRAQTWSNYKHHNTIKYLIGITPAGAISFLSDGWGGRVSDKEITVKSGFLEKLEMGDQIMADRGFLIADELAVHGATLTIPHFTKGKKQLSGREVDSSRQLARVRIHVERVIGRWKNYRILSTVIPISIADLMDPMVTLCACLTNISQSVVNKK